MCVRVCVRVSLCSIPTQHLLASHTVVHDIREWAAPLQSENTTVTRTCTPPKKTHLDGWNDSSWVQQEAAADGRQKLVVAVLPRIPKLQVSAITRLPSENAALIHVPAVLLCEIIGEEFDICLGYTVELEAFGIVSKNSVQHFLKFLIRHLPDAGSAAFSSVIISVFFIIS